MNPEAPVSPQKRGWGGVSKVSQWIQALTTQPPRSSWKLTEEAKLPFITTKRTSLEQLKKKKKASKLKQSTTITNRTVISSKKCKQELQSVNLLYCSFPPPKSQVLALGKKHILQIHLYTCTMFTVNLYTTNKPPNHDQYTPRKCRITSLFSSFPSFSHLQMLAAQLVKQIGFSNPSMHVQ